MHRTAAGGEGAAANIIEGGTPISATTSVSATTSIQKSAPMPNTQDTSSTSTMSEPPKGHPATISHSVSVEQPVQPVVETAKRKDEA